MEEGAVHIRGASIVRRGDENGASLVEYGLMLALIAVVCFSAVAFFGSSSDGLMKDNCEKIANATGTDCP